MAKLLTPHLPFSASANSEKVSSTFREGHRLGILTRHVAKFSVIAEEKTALWTIVDEGKKLLDEGFEPNGYNVRINVGTAAGETVMLCHIHLIPRRSGDSVNPRGGVRGVIAGKADYERSG